MKKHLLLLLALIAAVAIGLSLSARHPQPTPQLSAVRLYSLSGAVIVGARGGAAAKATLYVFWSPDCGPCLKELPGLQALYAKYHDQGLQIVGVMMFYGDPHEAQLIQRQYKLQFPLVWDREGQLARQLGRVSATPTLMLFNAHNQWAYGALGYIPASTLEAKIKPLLAN